MCDTLFALSAEVEPQPFPSSSFLFGRVSVRRWGGCSTILQVIALRLTITARGSCNISEGRRQFIALPNLLPNPLPLNNPHQRASKPCKATAPEKSQSDSAVGPRA